MNPLVEWIDWAKKKDLDGDFEVWVLPAWFYAIPRSLLIQSSFPNLFWIIFSITTKALDFNTQTNAIL